MVKKYVSTLQLLFLYKHLFFIDPNGSHPCMVCTICVTRHTPNLRLRPVDTKFRD